MKKYYILNQYNQNYDINGVFYEDVINEGQYVLINLYKGSELIYSGRGFRHPVNNNIKIDLTDICAYYIKPIEFSNFENGFLKLDTQSVQFKLDVLFLNLEDDALVTSKTIFFNVVFGTTELFNKETIDNNSYIIDHIFNDTESNKSINYTILKGSTVLYNGSYVLKPYELLQFSFKSDIGDINIRQNIDNKVLSRNISVIDSKSKTKLCYLTSNGIYKYLPILIDKSTYKKNYSDKTYIDFNKTIRYDISFKDSLDFKTPILTDNEYAELEDLISSNYVYLVNDKITKVNINGNLFEYKTFKNTKSFNQFSGTVDFMYENKRYY